LYEREIQSLKIEIETHKRNSFEAIGKINDIYNLLAMLKTKYENQKKEMKALTDAVDAYVE
jgi:predicted  nucleic acid-binding Zn-ribbon protein